MKIIHKLFKNKKNRLLAILFINIAVLSAAVVLSTVSWFKYDISIGPVDNMPSYILTGYFDKKVLPTDFNETVYPHGSANNPYVITKPIHYYNLVRLQELGTYNFDSETHFQFGKRFLPEGLDSQQQSEIENDYPYLFYKYNDNGVLQNNEYDTYLNMNYYRGANALSPIGSARRPFEGKIQGNDLTVKNLYIKGAGCSDIGIFGYANRESYIQNLYFDNVNIDAGNASAIAPGSVEHAGHDTHVYIGFLAGHIYNNARFSNVYINNCHIYNTVSTEYELINTFGFFGHTDEPMGSSEDTTGYTSQLVAANAYNALEFSTSLGYNSSLARRYTNEMANGTFGPTVTHNTTDNYYTINRKDNNDDKPYSLSSIGYSSGNAGTFKYARYNTGTDEDRDLHEILNVEPENVLKEKPKYIEYPEGDDPIDHSDNPIYDFYGMNDGDYIFYDNKTNPASPKWKYAKVIGDTDNPVVTRVALNCHTISYQQTVEGITKTFFLKYQAGTGQSSDPAEERYDTLRAEEWSSSTPPQDNEYYFCFRSSFGHNGVSRFTECSLDDDYYIYSPVGQKYLCTYCPKTPNSASHTLDAEYVHIPIFVPQEGISVDGKTNKHLPMLFSVAGPKTQITYLSYDNTNTITDVNADFDRYVDTKANIRGALQGSNVAHEFGIFGGHKMIVGASGGEFTIGDYIENQTTSLSNAVNYKLTSNSSEIIENATLVIAGYEGQQEPTYSVDYAMGAQMDNNRDAKRVIEVRDTSGYVLNDTTGVAKLVFNRVQGEGTDSDPVFTLKTTDGYLTWPDGRAFVGDDSAGTGKNASNRLKTFSAEQLNTVEEGKTLSKWECAKWKYKKHVEDGYYTRYRFQNVADPDRYLCYNVGSRIFAAYSLESYLTGTTAHPAPEGLTFFSNNNSPNVNDYNGYPNSRCWFYIYKQQHGQTIQNVHYTVAKVIYVPEMETFPYKSVDYYDLLVSAITNIPTVEELYEEFTIDPSYNVYFNTATSQVQYFESYVRVWKRVNLVSELVEGDTVMIGAQTRAASGNNPSQNYFMGTQATNYRNRSSRVDFKPPYVQADDIPTNASTFTLTRANGGWRFDAGNGFLYAAGGSSSNYLRTETTPDSNGNADWSISILTDGTANIVSKGRNVTRNKIQYGRTSNSIWSSTYGFTCFSGNQTAVQLYRLAQSSADRATYVGDLINNFEPFRMDAIGPNIDYYSDHMIMNEEPSIIGSPLESGDLFYPSKQFRNAITLLIDANGSRDLGTLKFECRTTSTNDMPYFYLNNGSHYRLDTAQAIDKPPTNNEDPNFHSYLLNINTNNIDTLTYHYIKGEGFYSADYKDEENYQGREFKICEKTDEDFNDVLTKYLVVLAAPEGCEIVNVTFTFNAIPGNIGYPGPVDYRTASYDNNNFFVDTYLGVPSRVEETALCIYFDMRELGQQLDISVQFDHATATYIISIDTTHSVLTVDLIVNIFKYDNDATQLSVLVDGVPVDYDGMGSLSVTIPANAAPPGD